MATSYWEATYKNDYSDFLETIVESKPDFIVPVARKSIKLMDAIQHNFKEFQGRIRYLDYFDFTQVDLSKSRVVIFDDAVRTASTLKSYRNYFEAYLPNPPMDIQTYGFIGHSQLKDNPKKNLDKSAKIYFYRSEASYQEYIAQQAEFLISKGTQPDIDHMVIELEVSDLGSKDIQKLREFLPNLGHSYQLEPIGTTERFGLHSPFFFPFEDILKKFKMDIKKDFVEKIKFCYLKDINKFHAIPMFFPTLHINKETECNLNNLVELPLPFSLPCQYREQHNQDKICYQSVCLLLNSLLARSFFLVLRDRFKESEITAKNIVLKRKDLIRYLGNQIGNDLVNSIEEFIKADYSPLDKLILQNNQSRKYYVHPNIGFPVTRENVPLIFKEMREGYSQEVQKNEGIPVGVKFIKSSDEMMSIGGGTHPLIFTEVLDEYCDSGSLVPVTAYNDGEGVWRRAYRTGEGPEDYLAWERTKFIIAFAIDELGSKDGVRGMLFEKAITNFVFDFPYPELHALGERESLWGPQSFAYYKIKNEVIPLDPRPLKYERLYDWRNLAEYFDYDRKRQVYTRPKPYKKKDIYFDNDSRVSEKLIRQYFQTLSYIRQDEGRSDLIYSLAICREEKTFLRYLLKSIQIWLASFGTLLDVIKQGKVDFRILKDCGDAGKSARDKVKYSNLFGKNFEKVDKLLESRQELYNNVWVPIIKENIMWASHPLAKYDEVHMLANVTDGISSLFELTRLKLGNKIQISNRGKTEKRVKQEGETILEKIGIPIRILHWPEEDDEPNYDEIYFELSEAHATLTVIVNGVKSNKAQWLAREERLEKCQATIFISTTPGPPDNVSDIIKVVNDYALKFGLVRPKFVSMNDLIDGQHDGNRFFIMSDGFGEKFGVIVKWNNGKPYVSDFNKIKA